MSWSLRSFRSLRSLRQVATRTGRFGEDVSAKKVRDVSATCSCRNVPYYLGFVFGVLETGPNQFVEIQKQNQDYIPVCRVMELKKNDMTIIVGMMQSIKRASGMSAFPLRPRGPLGPHIFPSC